MMDQAAELRKLVLRAMRENAAQAGPTPRLVVVAGGRPGVGVTTVAVNVSVAMATQGGRVILVDADSQHAEAAGRCGLAPADPSRRIAGRRCDIHEMLVRGPAGLQIVPGLWTSPPSGEEIEVAQQRLIHQFRLLGRHADVVLLDAGNAVSEFTGRFWRAADEVILVTTVEPPAIMDTYAAVKRHSGTLPSLPPLKLLVNGAADLELAGDVFRRLEASCRRFLGMGLEYLGVVPQDSQLARASQIGKPVPLAAPDSPATLAIESVAQKLVAPRATESDRSSQAA